MKINNQLLKHYLRNVLFINGTSYAGKSTMVQMLAEKYGLVHCGENYDCVPSGIISPQSHPNLCYFQTMSGWQEFISRSPKDYMDWIVGTSIELIEFEIMHLISVSQAQKTIVDTNIPITVLQEIASCNQVAIMLSPQSLSVDRFFDRNDPDKTFIKEQIDKHPYPKWAMQNYLACIAEYNSQDAYDDFADSGFFTIVRKDNSLNTKDEVLALLAEHFGLAKQEVCKCK